ncbi:MAG: metal ABC transporter solute-binding protein, Zn/Mn family [Acidimicrobiia bacterium]
MQFRVVAAVVAGALALGACGSSRGTLTVDRKPRGRCPGPPLPVVVSIDQWGDIVDQLAGDCGAVTTIFRSSSADPHDYEPTPAASAAFTGARLVVVNGLDYDAWADKAVATMDTKPAVINAGRVAGGHEGDNPHLWYAPADVYAVAAAVIAKLQQLAPKDATYFARRGDAWRASMRPYDAEIARIREHATGKTYAATEGIFDAMAHAVGLVDRTPRGFATTIANGSDPAPGDLNDFEHVLTDGSVDVLIDNTQTQGAIPDQLRRLARQERIPVVPVTESVPPRFRTFAAWQLSQLRDLATAVGA